MPQPMVTKLFRNPRALSSTLAALGALHPRALGFLNSLVTLVLASNYYLEYLREYQYYPHSCLNEPHIKSTGSCEIKFTDL